MKKIFTIKNIILGILFILIDLGVYIYLGMIMLQYEDFYDESKGPYWSLESMTIVQKFSYIGYFALIILNWFLFFYLFNKLYEFTKKRFKKQN